MQHKRHTCNLPVVFLCGDVNTCETAGTLENLSGEEGKKRTWEAVGLSIPSFFSQLLSQTFTHMLWSGVSSETMNWQVLKANLEFGYMKPLTQTDLHKSNRTSSHSTNYTKNKRLASLAKTTSGNHISDATVTVASLMLVPWCWFWSYRLVSVSEAKLAILFQKNQKKSPKLFAKAWPPQASSKSWEKNFSILAIVSKTF